MADGFRIERISVEGFKGFTKAQEIDLRNRHMFLVGPNGNGKSSIIEAIRWGLFGGRPNDIVANRGYDGSCRVELNLTRDGNELRLHRNLNRGTTGGSDARLFDKDGNEHSIRDVLPQMESLNAGEGTHIIFAPQSAPLRRQPEDLDPFERTVFGHLGLTHARVLLKHLEDSVQDQEHEETSLDGLVSDARKKVDDRIAVLERKRKRILESPPWDGGFLPPITDTESKAKELIVKIRASGSVSDFAQFSLSALVDAAKRALDEKIDSDQTPLSEKLKKLDDKLAHLDEVQRTWESIVGKKEELRKTGERLQQILETLDSASLDELQERVEKRRQTAETLDLRRRLGEVADELLKHTAGEDSIPCPICETERDRNEFKRAIQAMLVGRNEEDSADLGTMESQLNEAQRINSCIQALNHEIEKCESNLDATVAAEANVELTEAVKEGRVAEYIEAKKEHRASVAAQIKSFEEWHSGVRGKLEKLREEAEYQELQQDMIKLRAVDADMERVQYAFDQLVQFGESVRDIHDSVESALTVELRKEVPSVEKELTGVFRALTRHPHFDRLVIDKNKLPKLVLRVASSTDEVATHPQDVLNGQAQSALLLVPYFALSQADEAPTEVYLVLLDDPTRAFDREHIEILVERLEDLGKRVQLVVATQETETFRDLLPKRFQRENYVIVEPKNWSYADGPELVPEYS